MYRDVKVENGCVMVNGGHKLADFYSEMPKDWQVIIGATTAPRGYKWVSNGKSIFSGERRLGLIKQ